MAVKNDMVAAPLHWGHGADVFEVFIEPTCPFCVKALGKVMPLLALVGEDKLTIKLRVQSQPWHLLSGVVSRCVLAASTLPDGRDQAWRVLTAVGDHRDEFVLVDHATGPNRKRSLDDVIERIEHYSGIALKVAFDAPELQEEIKWHAKYARQNGIHVTPTFMLNGLVQLDLGSGDAVEDWARAVRNSRLH